ncbi:MAG TPA: YezD family protein [Opitutaceae bacterium]|jgi:hypothetical protein|nr:YezD family protein [Opitutaceae bacterium]
MPPTGKNPDSAASPNAHWVALVLQKVESLRYGSVHIIVQDGCVVQIERHEKTRLETGGERKS